MLVHRLRRWTNIELALDQRPVFAGILEHRTRYDAKSMSHDDIRYKRATTIIVHPL